MRSSCVSGVGVRDSNVGGNDQLAGLRPVRAYGLRTEEWGGIHPARRFQPAQAGLKRVP